MSTPAVSIIIPTYNEAQNILVLLQKIETVLKEIPFEILVVDDNSPDQTWQRVEEWGKTHSGVRGIRRLGERGLSSAVLTGFAQAQAPILGVMDGDLSHDERILPQLVQAVQGGADLAVGSRRIAGGGAEYWPWYRKMCSSAATLAAKRILRLSFSDPMSGYFLLSQKLYQSCRHRLMPMGYKILLEIYCKGRPRKVKEIPYLFKDRKQGYSKLSAQVVQSYLFSLVMLAMDEKIQNLRHFYHYGRYSKVKALLGPGTLLDIGCGNPCETMPEQAFLRSVGRGVGVDMKPMEGPFPFYLASIEKLPFEDHHFDNITALEILEHVSDQNRALFEIQRVLKRDGIVVVSMPNESYFWLKAWSFWEKSFGFIWHGTHVGVHPKKSWEKVLSSYFVIEAHATHWGFDLIYKLRMKETAKNP